MKIDLIREEARRLLPASGTHGVGHMERIYRVCYEIGSKLDADLSILLPAALLHDIGRGAQDHAREGSRKATKILEDLGFEHRQIEAVVEVISSHSFSGEREPASIEAKILSDADKLDAMGAVGIYRAAMYSKEYGQTIEKFVKHFHDKLLKLKDLLITSEAREIAEGRHRFMLDYLSELSLELEI